MPSTNHLTPESLRSELAELERRHGISSTEFIERYHAGTMGDSREVMHWAWLCTVAAKLGLLAVRTSRTAQLAVQSAEAQLRRVEAQMLGTGGTLRSDVVTSVDPWDLTGEVTLDLDYASGHHLAMLPTIDVSFGFPLWVQYSFHLEDGRGRLVFRYDNAPHHREVSTFPHHKHTRSPSGRPRVVAQPQPSLADVIREVMTSTGLEDAEPD